MALIFQPENANEHGLVAIGGDLRPSTVLHAYRNGIFPWYSEGEPILWWSPDPRAIFELDRFYISRRLERTIRSEKFRVTVNRAFADVMLGCADREQTWITADMIDAYVRLHRLGFAHSVEAWHESELVGGVYGVAIGGLFAGESMFHRATDASKVCLAYLMEYLKLRGYVLFDTQVITEHTASLGATNIPRAEYLLRLKEALQKQTTFID
ncbi:MAG: leucyl/phenylalanyl-tRNA--protein transferase [Planctomycetes bacterium]|nr:leucyl/phenylalanyl-tRNA--protein transferase [Planctomycetota bacterium]